MAQDKFWAEGSMSKEDMGEALKLIRDKFDLSMEDFAKEIGCSLQILRSSESGRGNHIYGTLMKACERFKIETTMRLEANWTIV
jgi:transcriptional regulator with XRE-family HTH domain